jgi:hypothetical protein
MPPPSRRPASLPRLRRTTAGPTADRCRRLAKFRRPRHRPWPRPSPLEPRRQPAPARAAARREPRPMGRQAVRRPAQPAVRRTRQRAALRQAAARQLGPPQLGPQQPGPRQPGRQQLDPRRTALRRARLSIRTRQLMPAARTRAARRPGLREPQPLRPQRVPARLLRGRSGLGAVSRIRRLHRAPPVQGRQHRGQGVAPRRPRPQTLFRAPLRLRLSRPGDRRRRPLPMQPVALRHPSR